MLGALVGLVVRQFRSRTSLIAENELLRQQLAAAKSQLQRKRVMFISTISSCLARAIFCASSRSTPASTTSLGHTRASGRNSLCLECPRLTVVSWHSQSSMACITTTEGRRDTRGAVWIEKVASTVGQAEAEAPAGLPSLSFSSPLVWNEASTWPQAQSCPPEVCADLRA